MFSYQTSESVDIFYIFSAEKCSSIVMEVFDIVKRQNTYFRNNISKIKIPDVSYRKCWI